MSRSWPSHGTVVRTESKPWPSRDGCTIGRTESAKPDRFGWTQSASVLRPTGHNQLADHVHRTQSRPDAIRDDTGQESYEVGQESYEAGQESYEVGRKYSGGRSDIIIMRSSHRNDNVYVTC